MFTDRDDNRIYRALWLLEEENPMWRSNTNVFIKMDTEKRSKWWRAVQRQADLGVPAMKQLVLKVIELRLKE